MADADKPNEPRIQNLARTPSFRSAPYYHQPAASQVVRDDAFVGDVFNHRV